MARDWEASELLVGMHETEGVGWITIRRVIACGALEGANHRRAMDWREFALSARQAANLAERLTDEKIELAIRKRERAGIKVVTRLDPEYPPLLKHIEDPPWVLYAVGRLELLLRPAIAVVGTRTATAYGKRMAEELSASCAQSGITVVSGLARGIDTSAHIGALGKPGTTIAVLASPVDHPYPSENRGLYREIVDEGLAISESPLGAPLTKAHFYLRNRIIAGLCQGALIVEAGEGSGALITSTHALNYNRDVYIVPGPITSPRSVGVLKLLNDGAKPVLGANDVLTDYVRTLGEWRRANGQPEEAAASGHSNAGKAEELTPEEEALHEWLAEEGARTIDELLAWSGMPAGQLHAALLGLQMKRLVQLLPGSIYEVI
ncbi:DNA-processing protein DprA [Cohnella fermenti]|uniref:DNA-protecting protein DprA n=1 Tax=Cohnella fermenti TaxID=2565925 RepID=A0A4S4C137_9BACL|nr:DNA-processing protein DprA [Cohnella fermenti]THF81275.1 DNA-protecting protein DprA [Cohnella fermenti]